MTTRERVAIKRKVWWYDRVVEVLKISSVIIVSLMLLGMVGTVERM